MPVGEPRDQRRQHPQRRDGRPHVDPDRRVGAAKEERRLGNRAAARERRATSAGSRAGSASVFGTERRFHSLFTLTLKYSRESSCDSPMRLVERMRASDSDNPQSRSASISSRRWDSSSSSPAHIANCHQRRPPRGDPPVRLNAALILQAMKDGVEHPVAPHP